jgi:SAM-dependent methyltransferase
MTEIPASLAQTSAAAGRNREPILAVLRDLLPEAGTVLEIASGTGEHAVHFARALPGLLWQPTDRDERAIASIEAHRAEAGLENLLAPLRLDAEQEHWPVEGADAVVAINMVHISPWRVTEGLMAGAARVLRPGGVLYLYGPYQEGGVHTAPSNEAFDRDLKARNPEWGIRDVVDMTELAERQRLQFIARISMPANNLSLVFRRPHP